MPAISIIIPVYNKIKYLENLFTNLNNQSFRDYECIIIDDGSTDGSSKLIDDLFSFDKRYKIFHIANGGVSNARNIGLDNATCEYITFIDSDDTMHPNYLLNLYNCIKTSNADLVISGHKSVWEGSERCDLSPSPVEGLFTLNEILPDFAKFQKESGIFGFCWAKILKKEICKNVYFDTDLALAEDFDFYLKIYSKIKTIYFDNKCYYYYLQQAENSSSIVEDNKIDYFSQIIINLRYKQFLTNENQYTNENKKIVDQQISNYIFFTIFHCKIPSLKEKFDSIRDLIESERVELNDNDNLQKWIFYLLKHNNYLLTKTTLKIYRSMRKIIKRR